MVIVVVEDRDDHELSAVLADELGARGERYGGEWGAGQREGRRLVGFRLFRRGGGFERLLITDTVRRELVEAILDVPHLVAVMPQAKIVDARTPAAIDACLGESLVVEVEQRSAHVARLLAPNRRN